MLCDLCGKVMQAGDEVRYEVKIEIRAAYDPLEMDDADLARDFRTEIAQVLRQLEGLSAAEAQDEVYRQFHFNLCRSCQRKVVEDPLGERGG